MLVCERRFRDRATPAVISAERRSRGGRKDSIRGSNKSQSQKGHPSGVEMAFLKDHGFGFAVVVALGRLNVEALLENPIRNDIMISLR